MKLKNFSMWRGRLPHWRADEVTYYVSFRHRRALDDAERLVLVKELSRQDSRKMNLVIACVLPEETEMLLTMRTGMDGEPHELSDVVEKAKSRAGRQVIKTTGERFPPFYAESYDRIVRDENELEERWTGILESPVVAELVEDPEDYEALFVARDGVETPMPGP